LPISPLAQRVRTGGLALDEKNSKALRQPFSLAKFSIYAMLPLFRVSQAELLMNAGGG